jgi:hypothetical protein
VIVVCELADFFDPANPGTQTGNTVILLGCVAPAVRS